MTRNHPLLPPEALLPLVDDLVRTVAWLRREVERGDPTMASSYAAAAVRRGEAVAMAVEVWNGPTRSSRARPDGVVSLAGDDVSTAVERLSDRDLRDLHGAVVVGPARREEDGAGRVAPRVAVARQGRDGPQGVALVNGCDRGRHLATVAMRHSASRLIVQDPPGLQPTHTRHDEEMPMTHRDDGRLAEAWRRRGATNEQMIRDAVELGLEPDAVTGELNDAAAFIGAAAFHDLGDLAAVYLEQSEGDPGEAWELWATDGDDE